MMVELIAELATAHGGDVALAEDMIAAAADSGAHTVKIQSYTLARLNQHDPQAAWLTKAHLNDAAHERLIKACQKHKVQFLSTPCDPMAIGVLIQFGVSRFKIASTEAASEWWHIYWDNRHMARFLVSWPWGRMNTKRAAARRAGISWQQVEADLTAIPLYPTPLECVGQAVLLDGYSDHTVGIAACQHMLSKGARIIEAHLCLPGRSRQMSWDKTPEQFRQIREWAENVETMTTGVSQTFRDRWSA